MCFSMPTGNPRLPESYVADRRKKAVVLFHGDLAHKTTTALPE